MGGGGEKKKKGDNSKEERETEEKRGIITRHGTPVTLELHVNLYSSQEWCLCAVLHMQIHV